MQNQDILINSLSKTYSNGTTALTDVSFSIKKGQFFGLLGPNGAGKSTFINILTSLILDYEGSLSIFGYDIKVDSIEAKRHIGLVPQEFNFNIFEPCIQILTNQAGYYGVPFKEATKRAEKLLSMCGLYEKRFKTAGSLSGGMKRRLMIARAMVHQPSLLILDEPTAGVDIALRREMWTYLEELNKSGITIILTTHYLEEAEYLCNEIGIIDKGQLITCEPTAKLLTKLQSEDVILYCNQISNFEQIKDFQIKKIDSETLQVSLEKNDSLTQLLEQLNQLSIKVLRMKNKANRLEEIFLRLTDHEK